MFHHYVFRVLFIEDSDNWSIKDYAECYEKTVTATKP